MRPRIDALRLLEYINTDPIKEIVATEIVRDLNDPGSEEEDVGFDSDVEDFSNFAKFYYSGKFSEPIKEAMVTAAVYYIVDPDKEGEMNFNKKCTYLFNYLPETEENVKFMFKVMKAKGQMYG